MIQEYQHDPEAWREPLKLWCGGENDATAIIRSIMGVDRILALECLADATRVEEVFAQQTIEQMKPALKDADQDDSIVRAFGLVASDRRPRGRNAFEFLVQRARGRRPPVSYVAALMASNLKEAADVIAELSEHDKSLVPLLEQMGNLAVPGLARRAEAGELEALRSLTAIGTPRAAQALVSVLGNSSLAVARASAIELMQLTASPAIEDAIAQLTLPATIATDNASALAWVWEPFMANRPIEERQTLGLIFGRIVGLLASVSSADLVAISRPLDARVAIFMFSFPANGEPRNLINKGVILDELEKARGHRVYPPYSREDTAFILRSLEFQLEDNFPRLLSLAGLDFATWFLSSIMQSRRDKRPTRREWLAMGDRQVFNNDGNRLYHTIPLSLTCIVATISAIVVFISTLHVTGWTKYLDFATVGVIVFGLAFIAIVPWHDNIADIWTDANDALLLVLLSPALAFDDIITDLDLDYFTAGFAILLFSPAWVYGFFLLLWFNSFTLLSAIVVDGVFFAVVAALFLTGRWKATRSAANQFRGIFDAKPRSTA